MRATRDTFGRFTLVVRLAAALAIGGMLLTACGSSGGDGDGSDQATADPCALLTAEVTSSLDDSMPAMLSGVEPVSTNAVGDTCVRRYESGDDWIEVAFSAADDSLLDELLPVNDVILTDGGTRSVARTAAGNVLVTAATSNPAGISTWDASLAGASALLR